MKDVRTVPAGQGLYALYLKKDENGNIQGSFLPENGGKQVPFTSLSRMVLLLEQAMDLPREPEGCTAAQTPTFELEILFRQNYSWQGRLRKPGSLETQSFRSVLELLTVLESAMAE